MHPLSIFFFLLAISLALAELHNWTPDDFDAQKNAYPYVLVNFLNPKCPFCIDLAPHFEAAAKQLETEYPDVAFVNADCIANPKFLEKFKISGYPTLMWFNTKVNPLTAPGDVYDKQHTSEDIIAFVKSKLADGAPLRRSTSSESPVEAALELTADTFNDKVLNSKKYVFVMFYAPWCGWCKKAHPIVNELAKKFGNDPKIVIATLDATVHSSIANNYKVQGYPTFKLFRPYVQTPIDYQGGRTLEEFHSFIVKEANSDNGLISDHKLGLDETMDPHVKDFMAQAEKSVILKKIEDKVGKSPSKQQKLYLDIMKKVAEKGLDYIESESKRLKSNIQARASFQPEKLKTFVMRSNILRAFQKLSGKAEHSEL